MGNLEKQFPSFFPFCFLLLVVFFLLFVCLCLLAPRLFTKSVFVINNIDNGSLGVPCIGCLKNSGQRDSLQALFMELITATDCLEDYC